MKTKILYCIKCKVSLELNRHRTWRKYCKTCGKFAQNKYNVEYHKARCEYHNLKTKEYRFIHLQEIEKERRFNNELIKERVIRRYGGECICCGEDHMDFLCLDHIDGKGNQHRKENKITGGTGAYNWAQKNRFPNILQVLCYNCNMSKSFKRNNNSCAHLVEDYVDMDYRSAG